MPTPAIRRNPFPFQATESIQGSRNQPSPDAAFVALRRAAPVLSPVVQPTLLLEACRESKRLTRAYLDRYDMIGEVQGQVVILHGEHGSGKTHTIRFVIQNAERHERPILAPLQLYTKAENSDIVAIYMQAMRQLSFDVLRGICTQVFSAIADSQAPASALRDDGLVASSRTDDTVTPAVETSDASSASDHVKRLQELFASYAVERGAVEEERDRLVRRVGGGIENFRLALSYVTHRFLGRAAYDWLCGEAVGPDAMRQLGVSGPLAGDEVAKWGLHLLAVLLKKVHRPLILYIDQFEKLVVGPDDIYLAANGGIMLSLIEMLPREGAMLVVAGSSKAWSMLSIDLKQRFALNVFCLPVLSYNEACWLLVVYLEADNLELAPTTGEAPDAQALYPYSDVSIRRILQFSGGNVRRILQIARAAWEEIEPGVALTPAAVDMAVERSRELYFSESDVRLGISTVLRNRTARFRSDYPLGAIRIDFAVFSYSKTPIAFINISEAVFHNDEVRKAQQHLELIEGVHRDGEMTPVILVVLGYVSPDVVARMQQIAGALIVFNRETFVADLNAALDKFVVAAQNRDRDGKDGIEGLEEQLAIVRAELESLRARSDSEVTNLDTRLAAVLERKTPSAIADRRLVVRQQWATERQKMEQDRARARQERKEAALAEIQRLAEPADSRHRTMVLVITAILVLSVMAVVAADLWPTGPDSYGSKPLIALYASFLIAVSGVAFALWPPRSLLPAALRALLAGPASVDALERAARNAANKRPYRTLFGLRASRRWMLNNEHPNVRLAGVMAANVQSDEALRALTMTLASERSSLIRRHIARRLGESRLGLGMALEHAADIPEVIYAVEGFAGGRRVSSSDEAATFGPTELQGAPPAIRIYSALRGALAFRADGMTRSRLSELIATLTPHLGSSAVPNVADRHEPERSLLAAMAEGLDRRSWPALAELSDEAVRQAERDLSPFDTGGLGTYDDLREIDDIDRLYLFVRQLRTFREAELLSDPS